MRQSKKIVIAILCLSLLAVSCNLFNPQGLAGIAKSVNGGVDWQFFNALQNNNAANLAALNISKLAFDPNNRQVIFAGGYNGGLYKSEDAAQTWKNILSKILVYWFVVDPQDSQIIYVAGSYNGSGKVLKTTDGGASWQEVYSEASQNNPVRSIALNPQNLNQLVIGTDSGTLIISNDGGDSWRLLKNFNDRVSSIIWYPSGLYVLLRSQGAQKSTDTGVTFASLTGHLATSGQNFISSALLSPHGSIGAFYQLYVDPVSPQLMYLTTDQGLYKSTDGGKTWNYLQLPLKISSNLNNRAVAVAENSSNVIYTNIDSTIFKSTDGGSNWQTQSLATTGFVNYILMDPQLPQIVYAGIYGGQ